MEIAQFFLTIAGAVFIILMWFTVWRCYGALPPQIPTHFGVTGRPDQWGSRAMIWLLPAIGTAMFFGLLIPSLGGVPQGISRAIALMGVEMAAMFWYIVRAQVNVAMNRSSGLGSGIWLFIIVIAGTAMTMHGAAHHP